jgi:hypothetical protein
MSFFSISILRSTNERSGFLLLLGGTVMHGFLALDVSVGARTKGEAGGGQGGRIGARAQLDLRSWRYIRLGGYGCTNEGTMCWGVLMRLT